MYIVKVLPYLNNEYFDSYSDKVIFSAVKSYISKYHKKPNFNIIKQAISKNTKLNETSFEEINQKITEFSNDSQEYDIQWLVDETESFCQNKAIENAIFKSVNIYEDEKESNHQIQDLIKNALSVSFQSDIGIDYFNEKDLKERYKRLTSKVKKIPSDLIELNTICAGGLESKSLTCLLGDVHVGKSSSMVSLCASFIRKGYNVLYVSFEMHQDKISQMFDANFTGIEINDIPTLQYDTFKDSVLKAKKENYERLIIRDFPTGSCGTNAIRTLLNELKLKKNFKPDILAVDYLNLMRSDRFTTGNSYTIVKAIAEELRGLMIEFDIAGLTASQLNREGAGSSNPTMRDTSESYGLPATVDLLIAMFTNEELLERNVIIWKSLKNRFGGIINYKFPLKVRYEISKIENMKDNDEDGVAYIANSEKAKAMIQKMKNKNENIVIEESIEQEMNELFK